MITNFKIFENQTEFNIGDWVYLVNVNVGKQLEKKVKTEPAQITSIKQYSKYSTKYTLTYLKGWQYSFVVENGSRRLYSWIRKASPIEIEKFKTEIAEYNFRNDAKRYNL